jgi:RNA recognition motif-containing protein
MDHPHASAAARLERQDSGEECAPGAAAPSGRGRPPSQLVRLYVAGLPKSMTEGQLKRMFEQVRQTDGAQGCGPGGAAHAACVKTVSQSLQGGDGVAQARTRRPFCPPPQWGFVRDVSILRERVLGLSRGCAFVGFACVEEAEAAIANLNNRLRLPGALAPLEVRAGVGRLLRWGNRGGAHAATRPQPHAAWHWAHMRGQRMRLLAR